MTTPTVFEAQWTGTVPAERAALSVTDTGGPGIPIVYCDGRHSDQSYWRQVITELGPGFRHLTFAEQTRAGTVDHSFRAAVGDVDAVLNARGVTERPLVIGWSGASIAAHWAGRNPDRALGAVLVEGAQAREWREEAMDVRVGKLFRQMGLFLPVKRPSVLTPRLNVAWAATREPAGVPTRHVFASGAPVGDRDERASARAIAEAAREIAGMGD